MTRALARPLVRWAPGVLVALAALGAPPAGSAQQTHVLLVVGIGGDPRYTERFHEWALKLREGLLGRSGLSPDNVIYLAEKPDPANGARGPSSRENVDAALQELAGRVGADDKVLVVLIGHGTSREDGAVLNLPGRRDLGADELALLLEAFPTQQVAVVNAASASGPFVQALSGPRRTVITATRTGMERNETRFGQFFADAFAGEGADLDKDGATSLFEAYEYARREVVRHYQEQGLLLTEHSVLDADGDGQGTSEPAVDSEESRLARAFQLGGRSAAAARTDVTDPALRRLLDERAALATRLEGLRGRRESMDAEAYDRELEALLVELALKDRQIREAEGAAR